METPPSRPRLPQVPGSLPEDVARYLRDLVRALEREMSYRRGTVVSNTVLGRQALLWEGQGDVETMLAAISAEPERR